MKETPRIEPRRKDRSGTQTKQQPTKHMVADKLNAAPPGEISEQGGLRKELAAEFGADACCPFTVQKHMLAIAEKGNAPYWRMVAPDRPFAKRLAGGPDAVRPHLKAEA